MNYNGINKNVITIFRGGYMSRPFFILNVFLYNVLCT